MKKRLTKSEKLKITLVIVICFAVISIFLNTLAVSVINDLTLTANGYKSDRNVCRMEIEEMKEDIKIRYGSDSIFD